MKRIICLAGSLSGILFFASCALAGNSVSFDVSATVPTIPGLNAPLIEEETVKPQESNSVQEARTLTDPSEKPLIQQDSQLNNVLPQALPAGMPLVILKTLYER
jgi:hypothetical protein